jgi:hypothetical protein
MANKRVKLTRKAVEGVAPGEHDSFLWDSEVVALASS